MKKHNRKLTREPVNTEQHHRVKLSGFNPVINGREIISAHLRQPERADPHLVHNPGKGVSFVAISPQQKKGNTMKQVKVSNPQHQKLLDRITGWKEIALVVIFILLAVGAVIWSLRK